ncbi:MAG: ABC transporter permease [Myxococcaceae bacterium]|nr:ABC transporter permease [Myxococcaceae bacterium]
MRAGLDSVALAFGSFRGNLLRSLLTLLGIVIGVATVVTMMALLEGLKLKVVKDFAQLGANTFRIDKWPTGFRVGNGGIDWKRVSSRPRLTLSDRKALSEKAPSVQGVSASSWSPAQKVTTADAETQPSVFVVGATPDYLDTAGLTVADGRFFHDGEDQDARRVAVLGPDVADKLFATESPLGREVRIKGRPYTVVGVLERRGKVLGLFNLDNMAFVPMNTFLGAFGRQRTVTLNVQARSPETLEPSKDEVVRILRQRRGVDPDQENNFEVNTNESMAKQLTDLAGVLTAATFGVCLLSLLVGGIGILNIMLIAVTERTKEIGIRKALGATRRRILAQFTVEAVVLSLTGGLLGIALGFGIAWLGRWALGLYTTVPTWAVVLSVGMSSGVGLVFGIYPAARASRLDPVEAMRAE